MKALRISVLIVFLAIVSLGAAIALYPAPVLSFVLRKGGCRDIVIEDAMIRRGQLVIGRLSLEWGVSPGILKLDLRHVFLSYTTQSLMQGEVDSVAVRSVDFTTPWEPAPSNAETEKLNTLPRIPLLHSSKLTIDAITATAPSIGLTISTRERLLLVRDPVTRRYSVDIGSLDGTFHGAEVRGLKGHLTYDFDGAAPADFQVTVDRLTNGVNTTELIARGSVLPDLSLVVKSAQVKFLDGVFAIKGVTIRQGVDRWRVPVSITRLNLQKVAALYGTDDLKLSGVINGMIPLSIGPSGVTVRDGILDAVPPGGVIEYSGSIGLDTASAQGALVAGILKHMDYNSLHANLSYGHSGDLTIAVSIRGRSPYVNTGQDVNVNLNLEENLPALLKSLRLARGEERFVGGH